MSVRIDIKKYLPHRPPMLMIDWVLAMGKENIETLFEIRDDNFFVQGGFFTETGLIENAAQTCSAIVGRDYFVDENDENKVGVNVVGFISSIKTLKIYSLVKTGDSVVTRASLLSKFLTDSYTVCAVKFSSYRDEQLLSEGEINLFIQENVVRKINPHIYI